MTLSVTLTVPDDELRDLVHGLNTALIMQQGGMSLLSAQARFAILVLRALPEDQRAELDEVCRRVSKPKTPRRSRRMVKP